MAKFTSETAVTAPHGFRTINGRKFGKRFGSKGGKARWASMSKEEKEIFAAKRNYSVQQRVKATRIASAKYFSNNNLIPAKKSLSKQDLEDLDEFFGDIM